MTAFAGIDYDTFGVHVVLLLEDETPHYLQFVTNGQVAFERARMIRDVMPARGWWEDEGIVAIGIEEPMGQSTRPLNRVQGAILSCLPRSLLVQEFRPSEWKTHVGLPGNASKEIIAQFVAEEFLGEPGAGLIDDWTQDACDAYCLALAVRKLTVFA